MARHRVSDAFGLAAIAATAAVLAGGGLAIAAGGASLPVAHAGNEPLPVARLLRRPFSELGAGGPIELRGVEGNAEVAFGVPRAEVVTAARLRLRFNYSPALLANLSHLRVRINGQAVAAVPLPKEQAGRELERELTLDPQYFTDFNHLRFDLIGHYTLECEDPLHSSLWASISDRSVLELELRPLALRNELAALPVPFFDRRDNRRLELPVVLPARATRPLLRSAGIVASWFGAQAAWRGARFPVSVDGLPGRHALVFATNERKPQGLALADVAAPTIRILDAPNDPHAKLLLFMGRDETELALAATGFVLGEAVLAGEQAQVTHLAAPRRAAYDAPRWLRSDRPVRFAELVDDAAALQLHGRLPAPLSLSLTLPPDLLIWQRNGVPIDLRYRYTAPIERDSSSLTIMINHQLVKVLRLHPDTDAAALERLLVPLVRRPALQERDRFLVPAFELDTDNQLQFQLALESHYQGACRPAPADIAVASIDADSTLDLSGYYHYVALPDLALFASAGFPFTRYADLAETAIVLGDPLDAASIEQLLYVLGRIGRMTGVAASAVRLLDSTQARTARDADLLVLSGAEANRLVADLGGDQLLRLDAGTRRFRGGEPTAGKPAAPPADGQPSPSVADVAINAGGSVAAVVGFESPLASGRSVVALLATDGEAVEGLATALDDSGKRAAIRGALAVVREGEVQSFDARSQYYVGSLPWWLRLWFHLSRHPLLLTLLALAVAATLAAGAYGWLQRRAARRKRVAS